MLAGRYPSDEFAELRPRLTWDRQTDVLVGRKGARLLSVVSGGTIPDRGTYAVHARAGGPRVGELDEEMVAESRKGETFLLGATTWRIEDITRDRVIVSPAPGEPGKMPFWRGEGPGPAGRARPRARRVLPRARRPAGARSGGGARLADRGAPARRVRGRQPDRVPRRAARARPAACRPIARSRSSGSATSSATSGSACCRRSAAGSTRRGRSCSRASSRTELGYPIHPLYTDDGIALRFADGDVLPTDDQLIPDPDDVEARAGRRARRGRACSPATSARTRRARCSCRAAGRASARRCGRSGCARSS